MDPKACFHTRLHLLRDLPPILFALQLALGCDDGLNEFALWIVLFELEVQTLDLRSALPQRFPAASAMSVCLPLSK
ncbi:hypothetical protein [Gymnodinialimonas sp.]